MRAVILTGCDEAKIGSLTENKPVAALSIGGKHLVNHLLDYLELQGMSAAVVACCRWPHQIESALTKRSGKIATTTVLEPPLAGSANVVSRIASRWSETFVLIMGDILTDVELSLAINDHKRNKTLATVVVCEAKPPCRYGEIGADRNGMVAMVGCESLVQQNGSRTANSGLYILEPEVFNYVPRNRSFDLARELLPFMVEKDLPIYASRQKGYWRAISNVEHYRLANTDLLDGKIRGLKPAGEEISPAIWVDPGVNIDPLATLKPPVRLGRGSRIERDAVIGSGTVLGEEVHIRRGAEITGSVVLERSRVGLATNLKNVVVNGNEMAGEALSTSTHVDDPEILELLTPRKMESLAKSAFDRVVALVALLLLSPLLLLVALMIRLDSPGPILYTQLRVGEGRRTNGGRYQGRVIEVMKFRTMYQDADRRLKDVIDQNEYGAAPFIKINEDPRITRVGRLLRATSMDEWPQFINVLRGEMALVGNRPLPLYEAEMLSDEWQQIRFHAPAGITGLWQISGRSDLSAEERMVLDNYYALTHSFWSDVKILLATIPVLLARRGAR